MKLLWSTEFCQIWRIQHAILSGRRWILIRLFPGVELHGGGHLLIFNNTLSSVISPARGVNIQSDSVNSSSGDLKRSLSIDLSHTLNFSELNIISFLVNVSFIFVNCNSSFGSFFYQSHYKLLRLFTILVCNYMLRTVVYECISPRPMNFRTNISNFLGSAPGIHFLLIEEFGGSVYDK